MSILAPGIFDAAMVEIREKSKNRLYQRDFWAWRWDVLGERSYAKMMEIGEDALFAKKPNTLIKSANGTSKTFEAARYVMWWCTAFEAEESLAIATAPTLTQVENGVFAYLKTRHGYVRQRAQAQGRAMPWPGWISEQGEWLYRGPGGNERLALARVPSASDAVSTFQGLRKIGGRNLIVLDEAGGVATSIYTAIEALMTGGDSRMVGIGNPDRRGTPFYENFTIQEKAREYNLHTISAYDLPTITGEIVYPDDPEKQALMLKGLTSASWVFKQERSWQTGGELYFDENFLDADGLPFERRAGGTPNGIFKAKVMGEFPGDADNAFFNESDINRAMNLSLTPPEDLRPVLGADVATSGDDESVVYVNQGGRVRIFGETIAYEDGRDEDGNAIVRTTSGAWSKEDTLTNARRIHAIAQHVNAAEVRIDANAVGSGVATDLMRLDEFKSKVYVVIRVVGSKSSSDVNQWRNWRDEIHAFFALQMHDSLLDLDPLDTELRKELMLITYELLNGAIKIDAKKKMFNEHGGSPDRADAAMYAVLNTSALIDNPYAHLEKGDIVSQSPWEMLEWARSEMALV